MAIVSLHLFAWAIRSRLWRPLRTVRAKTSWPMYRADVAQAKFMFQLLLECTVSKTDAHICADDLDADTARSN
jgi:hypothetical protein